MAEAQCTSNGLTAPLPVGAAAAVAGVSTSVGSLVSSIHTADTAFLTRSSAFIGSPANPQRDQPGSGVRARGIGGRMMAPPRPGRGY